MFRRHSNTRGNTRSKTRRSSARRPADGPSTVACTVGPASVLTGSGCVRVGDSWAATLVVTGYPPEAGMGWLEPLLQWQPPAPTDLPSGLSGPSSSDSGLLPRLDVAVHIDPLPAAGATGRLRKQRARLESARRIDAGRGRLDDPLIEAAAADAADLAEMVARGESRLFHVGVYLTVHAPTRASLHRAVAEVRAAAASVMLDTQPATWRQLSGWTSTLPLGVDGLGMRRVMDTSALAASFPLASPDLPAPLPGDEHNTGGVLFGITGSTGSGVLWWDRWAQDNHNSVTLASSGAGKSYLTKLDVLRNLYTGVHVHVIDPEDEYTHLADPLDGVGGTVVRLGAPGVRINPLDLRPVSPTHQTGPHGQSNQGDRGDGTGWPGGTRLPSDALRRRALFVHTLVAVLLGEPPSPGETAALDRAITAAYRGAGISADPTTWWRPAPLLADVVHALTETPAGDTTSPATPQATPQAATPQASSPADPAGVLLAARLSPWVEGSFNQLFAGPTTLDAIPQAPSQAGLAAGLAAGQGAPLVVWSTRLLPDELRAAGMLLALDAIWRDIDASPGATNGLDATGGTGLPGALADQWSGDRAGNPLPNRSRNSAGQSRDRSDQSGGRVPNQSGSSGSPHGGRRVRRLVVVDEAWSLMQEPDGARFLARMAKSARKRDAGLAVVTQDAVDLLSSDLGHVVVANSATQILMRQAPQAIDVVAAAFGLSDGEAQLLLSAQQGQALLLGTARIPYASVASWREHQLIVAGTSADPAHGGDPGFEGDLW